MYAQPVQGVPVTGASQGAPVVVGLPANQAVTSLELSFSCKKLKNLDFGSKSDPVILVYEKNRTTQGMTFLNQTEVIQNNLNPTFSTTVLVDYFFEQEQTLQIKVLDVDKDKVHFKDADFLGQTIFNVGSLVSAKGQQLVQQLTLPKSKAAQGMIIIRAEEATPSSNVALINASAMDLKPQHGWKIWHHIEPALRISRQREDGQWTRVIQTEKCTGHDKKLAKWKPLKVRTQKLCNSDPDRPLRIEITDQSRPDDGDVIGSCDTSLNALERLDSSALAITREGKIVGNVKFSVQVVQEPSFYDYIRGGIEIKLHVAIDFTASNGNPLDLNSLHYTAGGRPNCYQQIVGSVGSILLDYDSDKMVPAYGFGGKIQGTVSHAFPLTLNPQQVEVAGIQGMHAAYQHSLQHVSLAGPTLFAPIFYQTIQAAQSYQQINPYCYNILLVITDGAIHDLEESMQAVVVASRLPISIIIVGVGNADFSSMNALDADGGELQKKGQLHDNVQFVPYNTVAGSGSRLAREVLAELPEQAVHYFVSNGLRPPQVTVAAPPPADLAQVPVGLPEQYLAVQHTSNFAQYEGM
eukprot:GEMP01011441.1.p1 GENE.GEMP01011441.1~~GEMP01011441.1.p1  ORF type:complete len:579 (+),score=97.41 GEMP01011441.1:92-1828(+)